MFEKISTTGNVIHSKTIMIILLVAIHLMNSVLVSAGSSLSDQVDQTPADIYTQGEEVKIHCSHSNPNFYTILWYKQSEKQLQLLGYTNYDKSYLETGVNVTMHGDARQHKNCTLTIKDPHVSSSGVYFCAASWGDSGTSEAYFGGGTKLTVLEDGRTVTPPQVKILGPSARECRNDKDKKRKKTLVCVASGFYPDHVKVYWHMNKKNVTDGVATDEAARELKDDNNKTVYKITSRLRVYAKQWENPKNTFKCIVGFITDNGKETPYDSETIRGVQADTKSMSREKYLTTTQNFKVVYSVLTVKSCAYGAFVGFLVWKLQRFGGKQKY